MTPSPLLDLWQKPDGAGDPVGVLATTFVLEPDFFERDCLSRFLAVESVDERTGSADDLVARMELEDGLRTPMVTVLADWSAQAERSTLRWDLLHCHVRGGLLHSKVAVLLWENATRVILGSANLTRAGYRTNRELALYADVGPSCLLPRDALEALAAELTSYLDLVPGLTGTVPSRRRAEEILGLFRARATASRTSGGSTVAAVLAPTNEATGPLGRLGPVWNGTNPLRATQVSPYWDTADPSAVRAVKALLTGRPAAERRHSVGVVLGPGGETSFPPQFLTGGHVDEVRQLGPADSDERVLHAKALVVRSRSWVAALVGSSNHTTAGLGLGAARRRHRELNVWLGAPLSSREGQALRDLLPLGPTVDVHAPYQEPDDDEPDDLVVLPTFFQMCRLAKTGETWELTLHFASEGGPDEWRVMLPGGELVVDSREWQSRGSSHPLVRPVDPGQLPMFLTVEWDSARASWVVVADDRHDLPPGPGLADLTASQILDALARGRTLAQALREKLELDAEMRSASTTDPALDPLRRFDATSSLFRRGRALAAALTAMQRRLTRPVATLDALEARLSGPFGPLFLATKVVSEHGDLGTPRSEALFTVAEIALAVARVPWDETLAHVDRSAGRALLEATVGELDGLRRGIGPDPADLAEYASRAIEEAGRCVRD